MSDTATTQTTTLEDSDRLIGEAIASRINDALASEPLGVIIESPPRFDPDAFIETLCDGAEYDIGLALAGISEANVDTLQQTTAGSSVRVTGEVSVAVKWRNGSDTGFDWDGEHIPERTVVLVRGDHAKMGSLHRLTAIPLGEISKQITDRMRSLDQFADNAPAQAVWKTLGTDLRDRFGIPAIADYAVATTRDSRQAALEALGHELYRLRLFTDPGLDVPSEIPERLADNLDLVSRVAHMANTDRRRIMNSIRKGDDQAERGEIVEKLRRFERTGDGTILAELTYEEVKDVFSTSSQSTTTKSTRTTRGDVESASVELVFDDRKEELSSLSEQFDDSFEEEALENGENRVYLDYDNDRRLGVDVDDDQYYFIQHFVTENRFGGVIRDAESRQDAITNFQALDAEFFSPEGDDSSFTQLRQFADRNEDFESLVEAIDKFIEARSALVGDLQGLLNIPLIKLLGDGDLLEQTLTYIQAYRTAQDKLDKKYRDLQDASSSGASRVLSEFLLLDTIVLETEQGRELILSPLHPLHLWKYAELAQEVSEERESLSEEEREFLVEAVDEQPHVLRSIHVGGNRRLQRQTYLIQSDEFGKLPVFGEPGEADAGTNSRVWDYLLEKFVSAYPPAKRHLKISVVDPIQPSDLLKDIADCADDGHLDGATVEFVFIEGRKRSILEGTTPAQEEDITRIFGPDSDMGSFRIVTREYASYDDYLEHLTVNPKHFVLLNDRSEFYLQEFDRDTDTTIHPLYVPKEFQYDSFEDEISISPSKEGVLFSEYQNLVNQLYSQRQTIHNAEVHELNIPRETVDQLLGSSIWVCLSTPTMNTNPFWNENLISQERRGDRDYAIYSGDIDHFRRTLRRIINEYRIAPDDADLEDIAERIASIQQSGLLRLITQETLSDQQSRNTKGILGSIIAVQWLQEKLRTPKLIFSIDDPVTREWLNFDNKGRRADFLTVQFNDDGGLILDIVEVKALDEPDDAFTVHEEDDTKVVEGPAVEQLFESTETIRKLFSGEDNITIAPRKEALREQIYHELISSDVTGDKAEWATRINNVFRGEAQIEVNPRIISVEITNQATADERIDGVTREAQSIRVDRVPRQTITRLLVSGFEEESESRYRPEEIETTGEEDPEDQELTDENEETTEQESTEVKAAKPTNTDQPFGDRAEYADTVETLKRVLNEFDINIRDIDPDEVEVGPNIIRFKVQLAPGERQQKIEQRSEDIAREMALENEPIIHRLPNTRFIAIDVPRQDRQIVGLNEYVDNLPRSEEVTVGDLPFIAGIEPSGDVYVSDLRDAPHMLVGGTTGSGKTVFLYSLLSCILETQQLDQVQLAIIDPKLTNFMFFRDLPNLVTDDIITEADEAFNLFDRLVNEEIPRRKEILEESASVDIVDHNSRADDPLSPMVVVVDEYADLLDAAEDDADQMETNVRRIAQIARSVGIHLVIATQRPSANIINTDLRSNLDMRAAFRVPSDSDSRVILDENGAEGLGGDGDMLFKEGNEVTRLQGTLIEPNDLRELVDRIS
ncbi:DNA translocase FtsK [Halogeometricum sp. CBA1124]|uniref:DNA translocase FtsK n=1 Tax=Halogeometricum sp. CBA1124 TaxID=2668071 RepID=UPI00142AD4F4|nr:DNA translocase FtsK [Halogeometricum sp. CBA1124]MUV56069.1 hypothetical protein [Halogeometricum sp. CBA1124]